MPTVLVLTFSFSPCAPWRDGSQVHRVVHNTSHRTVHKWRFIYHRTEISRANGQKWRFWHLCTSIRVTINVCTSHVHQFTLLFVYWELIETIRIHTWCLCIVFGVTHRSDGKSLLYWLLLKIMCYLDIQWWIDWCLNINLKNFINCWPYKIKQNMFFFFSSNTSF